MILDLIFVAVSLFLVIKAADFAIRYSSGLAESFGLSRYVVGFIIVAVISVLPETFVAVGSAIKGFPSLGLGTLFGSNIADLTLVFALVTFLSGRELKIESGVIKKSFLHIGALAIAVALGLDGAYTRLDGGLLVVIGLAFYYFVLRHNAYDTKTPRKKFKGSDIAFLVGSCVVLLLASQLTIEHSVKLAASWQVSPMFIGMFMLGLGTTLPELVFSLKAAKKHQDSLALGDILGTVIADATIIVGLIALINPFQFDASIIYVSGAFMIVCASLLFYLMKTGKRLTRLESFFLFLAYVAFVVCEIAVNG